jgi:hypothetical protein
MAKKDRAPNSEAPTPKATERTVLGLDTTMLMLRKVGDRPGLLYDKLREELFALADVFRGWIRVPPTAPERIEAVNRLSGLMKQVYALDEREEPSGDPGSS